MQNNSASTQRMLEIEAEMSKFENEISTIGAAGAGATGPPVAAPVQRLPAPPMFPMAPAMGLPPPPFPGMSLPGMPMPGMPAPIAAPLPIPPFMPTPFLPPAVRQSLQKAKPTVAPARLPLTKPPVDSAPHPVASSSSSELSSDGKGATVAKKFKEQEKKKQKHNKRYAAGQVWDDQSMADWDADDFRVFCGDLGNEVTDETLVRLFSRYPSFQRARVIRDKRTNKTKGYGFVSFKDPADFIKAIKDNNGKYVGNRPIKLRKSDWKRRDLGSVRRKGREKKKILG